MKELPSDKESIWVLVGLCAIAASTLIVEIVLTKFIGYKVYHHYAYAVISIVIFAFAAAGAYVYYRLYHSNSKIKLSWDSISKVAALYSILLAVAVVLFCWLPIDPYNDNISSWLRLISHGSTVAWMWGVNSAFNVLGAMSFVPLTLTIGISNSLLIVAFLYMLANVGFAYVKPLDEKKER